MWGLWRGGLGVLLSAVFTTAQLMALSDSAISSDDRAVRSWHGRLQDSVPVIPFDAPATASPSGTPDLVMESHDQPARDVEIQGPLSNGRFRRDGTATERREYSADYGRDDRYQAVRLGLTGTERHFTYGARHRPASESAIVNRDQESREGWVGWQTNISAMTSTIQHISHNIVPNSPQAGMTTLQKRFALDLTLPAWPIVTVAYTQAVSNSAPDPIGFTTALNKGDIMETSLTYQISSVKLRAGTEYAVTDDLMHPAGSSLRIRHGISGSYSPAPPVTLTSAVSMTDERNQVSGQRVETPSAEIGLAYHTPQNLDVSVRSSYSHTYNDLGNLDLGKLNAKSRLSWDAFRNPLSTTTFSFETGYSTTVDLLRAAGAMDDLSAMLRMTVTGRSWSDWLVR